MKCSFFLSAVVQGFFVTAIGNYCSRLTCGESGAKVGVDCCCGQGPCTETSVDVVTQIEDGLWTLVTRNDPEMANAGPPNNRAVIFKIPDGPGGQAFPSLVVVNGVGLCESALEGLKALEIREGAPIRYVVTTGDWHHVYLKDYNEHFPGATVFVPPGRIPPLEVGLTYELLDMTAPLQALRPHLEVYSMHGLGQPGDLETRRDELFFFHPATKTFTAGDIMFYHACGLEEQMVEFWGSAWGMSMFNDTAAGASSAEVILSLPFERFIPVHGEPGSQVPPGAVPSAKESVRAALTTGMGPLAQRGGQEVQVV